MYPEKKLRQAPLYKPLLLTFRRRVQRGPLQGLYQDRIVATIQVVARTGTLLRVAAIENLNSVITPPPGFSSRASFWFSRGPDTKGNAVLNPLYLQTIEEFPERDLPLLLGWPHQYPGLEKLIRGDYDTPGSTRDSDG